MRIHLPTTWALLGAVFSIAAAEGDGDWPHFTFDQNDFVGEWIGGQDGNQSSVFLFTNLAQGKTFRWGQTGPQVDILQVQLMSSGGTPILSWCPNQRICATSPGVKVVVQQPESEIQLTNPTAITTLSEHMREVLSFHIDWQIKSKEHRQQQPTGSASSQQWAVVGNLDDAAAVFSSSPQMTPGAPGFNAVPPSAAATDAGSDGAAAPPTSGQTTPPAAEASGNSGNSGGHSGRLTTGAIVGIVVGAVGGLILVSVIAGCFCFRRRRRRNGSVERGGSRGVQAINPEKGAHTSIIDRDRPGTPYSEQNSQQPLNSHLDLGIGLAMTDPGSIRTESPYTVAASGNRGSAMYSSLGGGSVNSGTPVMGSGPYGSGGPRARDRSSMMGSPVPYMDDVGHHEYGQLHQQQYQHHHHVVDGADLLHQDYSNKGSVTELSRSSIYSMDMLDEAQPISPESPIPREDGGVAPAGGGVGVGGGGGGGASAHGPPGHGRPVTPSGISGQYAHLVEEGMTADEIRRLEEEERALDEAIEQAGTAGRKR